MLEGPEIRRSADTIANALIGEPVAEVFFAFEQLAQYASDFEGSHLNNITPTSAFRQGAQDIFPILFGALPFGIVVGVVSAEVDLTSVQTFVESAAIFAGAAQLVMLDLLDKDAALWVIVLSASILNLRHVIYSASLASYYKELSPLWKAVLSFVMVDQVYALSYARHSQYPTAPNKQWYHLGLALPIGIVWLVATLIGYFVGAIIPESWSLTFVIPLMFLALLVPAVKGRSYLIAAVVSAVVIMLTNHLPHNLGLLIATFAGIATGFILGEREID